MRPAAGIRPAPPLAPLSDENYRYLQDFIQAESGIAIGEDKLYLLQARLGPIVEAEHLKSLNDLCAKLRSGSTESLRRRVVESMTTHETLFFRDPAVYDALRTLILPELITARKGTKILRIWSAACSSGQEPYSLAMLLLELGLADWNIQILGTDLSHQILAKAIAGKYLQLEVNRGLPATCLVKYFQRVGMEWQLKDAVRRLVRFTPFDLRGNITALGPFDLVLCRNVLIYFDMPTRKKILGGIRASMFPGGYLLLGASETTFNLDNTLVRKTMGGTTAYQMPIVGGTK